MTSMLEFQVETSQRTTKRTLCVVVPLYNEEEGILAFHDALTAVLRGVEERYEWTVLYVVDPSRDDTASRVRELASRDPRVGGIFLLRRAGHQMSLIAGMQRSHADACITMDGDLQHPPEMIPRMLEMFEDGADVVQTVRLHTVGQGRIRRTLSVWFYRVINRLSSVPMVQGGADFRLMSARVVRILCEGIVENDRFIRGLIPWLGLPTSVLEFTAPERVAGKSSYTMGRSFSLAASGIVSFSKVPLHFGIGLGLVVSVLGLLGGIGAVVARLSGAPIPAGWTSLVVMMALLAGAQLITLGIIGMYIGVVFDETKRRPQILVADSVGAVERDLVPTSPQPPTRLQPETLAPREPA